MSLSIFINRKGEYARAPREGVTSKIWKSYIYKVGTEDYEYMQMNPHFTERPITEIPAKPSKKSSKNSFQSSKVFDGFSTVFRQHSANGTHCRFLHGYGISFKITFEGELDSRNWVWDFGGMKRAKNKIDGISPKAWMDYMFDHTVILAEDDPELDAFKDLNNAGALQLRVIPAVGAEKFAEFIFHRVNNFVQLETEGRVRVTKVKFMEHGKNSATFRE